jgi:hypothetical protein
MWRDSIAAFWIVTAALTASFLVSWIPWAFLFRWVFKIFVYVVLGPWMKIVDICYVRKKESMTRAERQAQTEAEFQRRYDLLLGQSYIRRLMNERNEKLRDFNRYMFGKVCSPNEMSVCSAQIWVSFLITLAPFSIKYLARVPIFKEERYPTVFLASSSAVPYDRMKALPINIVRHINGQSLSGDMVPTTERFYKQPNDEDSDKETKRCTKVVGEVTPLLEEGEEKTPDNDTLGKKVYGTIFRQVEKR